MGILANHVPTIEQLNPGVVEVVESAEITKKFFGKKKKKIFNNKKKEPPVLIAFFFM